MNIKKHIININNENENNECLKFLNNLEEDYLKYKRNWEIENDNFYKYEQELKYKDIHFIPEKVLIKSPITIIDSPWGIGKTYFLETICKLICQNEIKTIFKSIVIIDASKFLVCDDIPNELLYEIISKIANKKWEFIKNIGTFIYNILINPMVNGAFLLNFKEIGKIKIVEKRAIKKLNKIAKEPVLLIIDNIERLNQKSWDVIRTIQKLTVLDNFLFYYQ